MLDPKGLFNVYRKYRDDGFGGVVIFINKCIDSTPISVTNHIYKIVELIRVTVQYFGVKIVVCCLYCPPNLSFKVTLDCLKTFMGVHDSLIFDVFNLPKILWNADSGSHVFPESAKPQEFFTFCLDSGLVQINNFPTRGSIILDLILVAYPLLVSDLSLGAPFGGSDHASLTL